MGGGGIDVFRVYRTVKVLIQKMISKAHINAHTISYETGSQYMRSDFFQKNPGF
jgi:hypothetical protein